MIKERSIRKWKTCGERGIDKKKKKEINKLKEKKELIKEGENGVDKRKEKVELKRKTEKELLKEKRRRNWRKKGGRVINRELKKKRK